MSYKRSFYNVEIEELEDGRKLIYNTYSGIYGIMDKKTQKIYNNIENFDASLITDEEALKNIDIMKNSGYIVSSEKDELATIKLERAKSRYMGDSLALTIAPTMDCNMRCPYCYEKKNDLVMSAEIQDNLISFVKAHIGTNPKIKNLYIWWYGGEPLMQKEIIYSLSERLIGLCNEKELSYSAGIVTNGSLLDAETAEKLVKDCKVDIAQITIDGMNELHNKRRILINAEDSYNVIMKNIEACKDIIKINVRINVDKENMGEIETLIKFFLEEKGWKENPFVYLAPVDSFDENCVMDNSVCLQGREFAEINNKFLKINYLLNRDNIITRLYSRRRAIFCGAEGVLNYVVDPEGYLYNCWHCVGITERNCGHINEPFLVNTEYAKWLLMDLHEKCEKCEYLPMCQSGCSYYRLSGDGTPKCFHTLYSYKEKLKLAYEDYVLQKSIQKEASATL